MSWLKEVIGTEKAVIAMCHLRALPGDPSFDAQKGMNWVIDRARDDLLALQNGGVDAVMFSNIVPEAAVYLGNRDICSIAKSTVFNNHPDALCVSGLTAGAQPLVVGRALFSSDNYHTTLSRFAGL